jgi:hypothetical protein
MSRFESAPGRLPNWIAGAAVQPVDAVWHRSAAWHEAAGTSVPRSGHADVSAALVCAERELDAWRARGAAARAAAVARWLDELRGDELVPAHAAAELGLAAEEGARLAELELARCRPHATHARAAPAKEARAFEPEAHGPTPHDSAPPPVLWCAPHASELGAVVARACTPSLAAGAALLLAPDPRWPHGAHACAAAWRRCDLPGGVLQVLHGIERLDRTDLWPRQFGLAVQARARVGACVSITSALARGAELDAWLDTCVERCARDALGRVHALGGHYANRCVLVRIDVRLYADCVERLLARLSSGRAGGDALVPVLAPFETRADAAAVASSVARFKDGGVAVRPRADGPLLYLNVASERAPVAELAAGPWLCVARSAARLPRIG